MKNDKNCDIKLKLGWLATIWSKWQIVIPKDIRDKIWLKTWDQVALLYSLEKKHISIVKNDDLNKLFELARDNWIIIE